MRSLPSNYMSGQLPTYMAIDNSNPNAEFPVPEQMCGYKTATWSDDRSSFTF